MARKRSTTSPDAATRKVMRGVADEQAVAEGCRFDEERASHAVTWIESTCHLYEGDCAGQLIQLMPWQRDFLRRLFGWVRPHATKKWVRRFTRAILFVSKKNGKSGFLAAIGTYLFDGDGEMGQKVYTAAKDGRQALISHTHAEEMVKRSPSLSRRCKINGATHTISCEATSSQYRIVAGDNVGGQEGLNGSVLIDELHVVDRRLAEVLRYAGASRAEPLQVEVSTAGNDPDSYGKERFDYAADLIANGGDTWTLAAIYAAPQELTPAELDADPEKYGRMANPSWGVTIDPAKFLAEYSEAKKSLPGLLTFLMYRLCIWQQSASPWLRMSDWLKCQRDYAEADLAGRECCAGLDLSRTRDMTALVLAFPDTDGEGMKLLAYFFLPEERAAELAHLIPQMSQWIKDKHLILTPGNVIDYGFIKREFRRLARVFDVRELAYDRMYAEDLTQDLVEGEVGPDMFQGYAGIGCERYEFAQSVSEYAMPTADFEAGIISTTMTHNGHPVLTWQAGHVKVRTDANANKRPVKPKPGDHRSVDGIQAAIMAAARVKIAFANASSPTVEVW